MLRTVLVFFLLAAGLALGGVVWLATTPAESPPTTAAAPEAPRAAFIVAARAVRTGALLRAEDLGSAEMEVATAPPGAQRDDRDARAEMVGAMVRRSLQPNEAIRPSDLLRPGDRGFLAAVLAPDTRAFSISVDLVTGAAGLIWPGDRVDLLLTQQLSDETIPVYRRTFGETVLTDVRVIAVDQAIMQGAVGDAPADASRQAQSRTVTLELTGRQAEVAAVATRLGRLSLLLRSATETPHDVVGGNTRAALPSLVLVGNVPQPSRVPEEPRSIWAGDVSPGLRQGRTTSVPPRAVQVFLGPGRREEFRY